MWAASISACKKNWFKISPQLQKQTRLKTERSCKILYEVSIGAAARKEREGKGMKQHQQDKLEQVCLYFVPLTNSQQ